MPAGLGLYDLNGVWRYGESDVAPSLQFSDLLNLGMASASDAFGGAIVRLQRTIALNASATVDAFVPIDWDLEAEDSRSAHPSGDRRVYLPHAGLYLMTAYLTGYTNANWGLQARINGAVITGTRVWSAAAGIGRSTPTISKLFRAPASAYLEIEVACSVASGTILTDNTALRPTLELIKVRS